MDAENLKILIPQNKSINEIGKILNKSPGTVSYWLKKYKLKTNFMLHKRVEVKHSIKECRMCRVILNKTNRPLGRGNICRTCKGKDDVKRRKRKKNEAIINKGGKCNICGYDKTPSALEFHHIYPGSKEKAPHELMFLSWDKQKEELDKCILLCANCHREVHDRLRVDENFNVLDWVSDPDSRYN